MKKILKKNLLFFLTIIIFSVIFFSSVTEEIKAFRQTTNTINNEKLKCKENNFDFDKVPLDQLENYKKIIKESCEDYNALKRPEPSTMNVFFHIVNNQNTTLLAYITILLIILPSMSSICTMLKSQIIKMFYNRESHKRFLKKLFKEAYRYAFLLPLIGFILLSISFFISGHFDNSYNIIFDNGLDELCFTKSPLLFSITYLLNLFFYNIFFINVGLIVTRKNYNIILVLLESFLIFIGLDLIIEVVLNRILMIFIKRPFYHYDLLNVFNFTGLNSFATSLFFSGLLALISGIIAYLLFKNKEKLIIDCGKTSKEA